MDESHLRKARVGLVLAALLGGAAWADNPVVSHRHLADPNGFVFGDRIYAICSNDDENNGGYNMKGAVLLSTKDLVNWTDHGEVYYAPKDTKWAGGSYAPTATVRNGKVYYYFPNVTSGVGVMVADRPEGPLKDPLGKALVSGTLCDNVAWCFDPDIFVDDDGQAYLVYGGGSNTTHTYGQNIRGIKVNADMISVSGAPVTVSLKNSFEGPFVHKYKGNYYFHYPASGGAAINYEMSSTSPIAGFTFKGTILPNPTLDGKNVNLGNNSHESVFQYKGNWYMMYHDRRLTIREGVSDVYKRSVNIDKLEYNADGTIKTVIPTTGMAQIASFNPYDSVAAVTCSRQSRISAYTDVNNSGTARTNLLVPRKSGAWMRISMADFGTGAKQFQIDGGGTATGASVEVRSDSAGGTLYGTCSLSKSGSWTSRSVSRCDMTGLSGVKDVYLKFVGTDSTMAFDWFRWIAKDGGATGLIQATRPLPAKLACTVRDLQGRTVGRFEIDEESQLSAAWRESSRHLPTGTFLVSLESPGGTSTRRFVRWEP